MRPADFGNLMQRFFRTAVGVFTWADAIVDKMVGDEVIAIFAPSITGPDYRRRAAMTGLKLLHATGHSEPGVPWLSIGVGVHAGTAFVGSIGIENGNYQFAALGETMNVGARLVAAAAAGEMVMSEAIWNDVCREIKGERRDLRLKGYDKTFESYVASVDSGAK
jgi:adenylate cyclase